MRDSSVYSLPRKCVERELCVVEAVSNEKEAYPRCRCSLLG